jgi:hypothetical protein
MGVGLTVSMGPITGCVMDLACVAMRYHFRVSPPDGSVKLRILETDREGPLLSATFHGRRRALTTAALLRSFFSLPAGHLQNRRGDPLASAAALAQGRTAGAAAQYCSCEQLGYHLGGRRT